MAKITEITKQNEVEDLEECAREDRTPRVGHWFRVRINDNRFVVTDPVITGRQLLDEAGNRPVEDFLIFLKLRNGLLEEIRLDETVDLRKPGVERFLVFKSDRSFRFELDGRRFEWGTTLITGRTLKNLADMDLERYGVWREVRDGEDLPIDDDEFVDLSEEGLERFFTAPHPTATFEIIVNARPHTVTGRKVTFEQLVELAFPNYQPNPNIVFSMTYRHAASKPHAGELGAGGVVEVDNGTLFNVTRTDKS